MRLISLRELRAFWSAGHAKAEAPLREWAKKVAGADWRGLADVRATFRTVDAGKVSSGKTVHVFNVAGNDYRLIAAIHFNKGIVFALRVLTHAQYDKGNWKADL